MKNIESASGITIVPNLKSRKLVLGAEAQKKHEEILALIERSKKLQKQVKLV